MTPLSRVAIVKIVNLASRGYELLSTSKVSVEMSDGKETATIDTYGKVNWQSSESVNEQREVK